MASFVLPKSSKWFSTKSFFKRNLSYRWRRSSSPLSPSLSLNLDRDYELREVFRYFDYDKDGKISSEELRTFFSSLGDEISLNEVAEVIREIDSDGDCLLDFSDFVKLMEGDNEKEEDLKMAFTMFEAEEGEGCITPRGLQKMLRRLGDEKSYEECKTMINVFDLDGNGVLDIQEFCKMMA